MVPPPGELGQTTLSDFELMPPPGELYVLSLTLAHLLYLCIIIGLSVCLVRGVAYVGGGTDTRAGGTQAQAGSSQQSVILPCSVKT